MGSDELGLFGPDSVTWRVHGDPTMVLGGLRALLLQALHPLPMAAVAQSSGFRDDPWGRLRRTAEYVGVTTFGTASQAEQAASKVRRIHTKVTGIEPESGRRYRADDPELLRWVHCCETSSFLTTAVRGGLRLTPEERDGYYAEQVRSAHLLGLGDVPSSQREMDAYFAAMRPQLRATEPARAAARFVLLPPVPRRALPALPLWTLLSTTAFALLPRWARRMYRTPGLPTTDLGATAVVHLLRSGALAVPETWRQGPHRARAKQRLSA